MTRSLTRRAALVGAVQSLALLAAACAPIPRAAAPAASPQPTLPPTPAPSPTPPTACLSKLAAVVPPTPIPYPGYVQVEPSTGLHVTAQPQVVDLATYRLQVNGKVARELSLTFDEIRCLPKVSAAVTIQCPGFFVDHSNLAGASLAVALALAEPLADATRILFVGVDGRSDSIELASAQGADNFLAYEWEGEALPASHGFPVRMALPGYTGGYWVKWLKEITVL